MWMFGINVGHAETIRNPTFENVYPSVFLIAVAIPITNAWLERGASSLKNIKTKLKNQTRRSNVGEHTACLH